VLATGAPFSATTDGPGYTALTTAMGKAYGSQVVFSGQGGSIPLCTVLSEISPRAEIALLGVEEPNCRIHAPNESVDPGEISKTALSLALFLSTYQVKA
jgi:acetylornithine deacetylase/succinyl-diaminopimelate desuccinylase-like protein